MKSGFASDPVGKMSNHPHTPPGYPQEYPEWAFGRGVRVVARRATSCRSGDLLDRPSEADLAACRAAIRHGSHSFFAASKLLPQTLRDPSYALYAFCRLSDDAVDLPGASRAAVDRLRARLDRIYAGNPASGPEDRALADVVRQFDMPRALPEALLEGLEWDRDGRAYETISDLRAYAARVAGAVGAMMAVLMGVRSSWMLARACDLGVAMQLTNVARDIGEDARNGRLYVPREWMRQVGIDPEAFLADPQFSAPIALLTERLLAEADRLYLRSEAGISRLPMRSRPAIWAARRIYADIGREIALNEFDSINQRAVTSKGRKMVLLARALADATTPKGIDRTPALDEVDFLVNAAARGGSERFAWWELGDGTVHVMDVLNRVGTRRQG